MNGKTNNNERRVLVIDEASATRQTVRDMLSELGYAVVEAGNRRAAIELVERDSLCMITLNLMAPPASGLEILVYLRQRFTYSELPVVVISDHDASDTVVEALRLGANDYITTPVDRAVLAARLKTHLQQWQTERELRVSRDDLESRVVSHTTDLELSNRALRNEIDERRKSDQALRTYEQMTNSASDILAFVDHHYQFVAVNRAFLTTLELTAERVIGQSMEMFGELFEREFKPRIDVALRGVRVSTQLEKELPGRGMRTLDVRYDPHFEGADQVTGVVITARDVTEHKRAESALRALAQSTAHGDTAAFARTCIEALIDTYNVDYAQIAKLDEAQQVLRTIAVWNRDDFVENFSYPIPGSPCQQAMGRTALYIENKVLAEFPGFEDFVEWQPESYVGRPLRAQDGQVLGVVSLVHSAPIEVSAPGRSILETFAHRIALELERNAAVEESEKSLALHRATLENTRSGILVVDLERRILSYNQRYLEMWNIPLERMPEFIADHRKGVQFVAEQMADPEAYVREAETMYANIHQSTLGTLHFRDGRIFERYTQPYRLGGKVIGRALNFLDITERVVTERELEDYRNNLEQLVRSRTAELEAANAELASANNEIASFSYSVSHDLRAPLRSIDGFSKLMIEDYGDKLDDNAHVYLDRIRNASQRMGGLIDDMLLLSRLSRRGLSIENIDLADIAREVARKLFDAEPERKATIEIPQHLPATADSHLVQILLENLLGNAWKYSRKQAHARIELGAQIEPGEPTVFYVRDNGVGFDMKYVDKLFQPFQRLHTVTEFEGTGIGLATVAQIARRHRGDVWAEGRLNDGATIYFTLDAHDVDGAKPIDDSLTAHPPEAAAQSN